MIPQLVSVVLLQASRQHGVLRPLSKHRYSVRGLLHQLPHRGTGRVSGSRASSCNDRQAGQKKELFHLHGCGRPSLSEHNLYRQLRWARYTLFIHFIISYGIDKIISLQASFNSGVTNENKFKCAKNPATANKVSVPV